MVRTIRYAVAIPFLLIGAGCTRLQEWPGDPRLARPEVQAVVAQIHDLTNRLSTIEVDGEFPWQGQVANAISAVTNLAERVALLDELTDCLFALDVSSLTYRRQLRALKITRHLVKQGVLVDLRPRFDVHGSGINDYFEWCYGVLLKDLAWSRGLIERTKSKCSLENNRAQLGMEEAMERKAWSEIYYGEIIYYDVALRYLEGSFYYDKKRMSENLWNRLKIKIEAFLERPLRPKEQVEFGVSP